MPMTRSSTVAADSIARTDSSPTKSVVQSNHHVLENSTASTVNVQIEQQLQPPVVEATKSSAVEDLLQSSMLTDDGGDSDDTGSSVENHEVLPPPLPPSKIKSPEVMEPFDETSMEFAAIKVDLANVLAMSGSGATTPTTTSEAVLTATTSCLGRLEGGVTMSGSEEMTPETNLTVSEIGAIVPEIGAVVPGETMSLSESSAAVSRDAIRTAAASSEPGKAEEDVEQALDSLGLMMASPATIAVIREDIGADVTDAVAHADPTDTAAADVAVADEKADFVASKLVIDDGRQLPEESECSPSESSARAGSSDQTESSNSNSGPGTPSSTTSRKRRTSRVSSSVNASFSQELAAKKIKTELVEVSILQMPGGKPSSSSKKKAKSQDSFDANQYPTELLVSDAYKLTKPPMPVCTYCLNTKFNEFEPKTMDELLLKCSGECTNHFHKQCLLANGHADVDVTANFKCPECTSGIRACFACKETAADLVKCPDKDCGHFYHYACLAGPQPADGASGAPSSPKKLPRCPQHHCHTCARSGREPKTREWDKSNLSKCNQCVTAHHFHFMCMPADAKVCIDNPLLLTCYKHQGVAGGKKKATKGQEARRKGINATICFHCKKQGDIFPCATCPFKSDVECAGLDEKPDPSWQCPDCAKGNRPMLPDIVWFKMGSHRIWPCQIVPEVLVPEKIRGRGTPDKPMFVRFLGTTDYGFVSAMDILPYEICDPKWKRNPKEKHFAEALMEAKQKAKELLRLKTTGLARFFVGQKPVYNKIRSNKAIAPAKYITSVKKEDAHECECKPTDPDPCGPTSNCLNRDMEYECNPKYCSAGDKCQNQRIRKKEYPKLDVFFTANRGWALKVMQDMKKGDLVVEYVGEIITVFERNRRIKEKQASGDANFYYLDLTNARVIDAGPSGNVARFANHSCDANTSSQKWVVDGDTHIALIATRDIKKGDEITFDYRWEYEAGITSRECLCGADNCPGTIGGKTYEPTRGRQLPTVAKPKRSSTSPGRKRGRKSSLSAKVVTNTPEGGRPPRKRGRFVSRGAATALDISADTTDQQMTEMLPPLPVDPSIPLAIAEP